MTHVANRRALDPSEITTIDAIMRAYNATRSQARSEFLAAQTRYLATIGQAADDRDAKILVLVDAAAGRGHGTLSRVAEYIGMSISHLSSRLRKARGLRDAGTKEAPPA